MQSISNKGRESLYVHANESMEDNPTIERVMHYWLSVRRGEVKKSTWKGYRYVTVAYVIGPLLTGTTLERQVYTRKGAKAQDAQLIELLGPVRLAELKTARIRQWHRVLCEQVGGYTAKVAKKYLRSGLALIAEDFELGVPPMPANRGRGIPTTKKTLLSPAEIGQLLRAASNDDSKGIYYAFPFLTGVRPSEQLALLWDDVDFAAGIIRIRRMQESDGSITELTKTAASTREVPISPLLKSMLSKWRAVCPIAPGLPHRVFPALGVARWAKHKKRCCPLSYVNFRNNYWRPVFVALGLPYVTPHSARHSFISTLQASGIEIGLVAKLAGHANPSVTLGHYTQAVRCGDTAIAALERAYITSNGFSGEEPGDPVVARSGGSVGSLMVNRPAWGAQ